MKHALKSMLWSMVLLLAAPLRAQEPPQLDVAFLLDATGSMGDEIDAVKDKIQDMISTIALGNPAPEVRFGIVAYRDRGDEYVTAVYELTSDIDAVIANLHQIKADGGGDYPESLNEALHATVHELNWDQRDAASRLVFLIADAPPHLDYPDDYDYVEEYQMAAEKGIAIHAIGASGLDEEGERIYKEISAATGGQFEWLAYESRYVDQDGEEVVVVVEGRTATYHKADSTWTVEGPGAMPEGGPTRGGAATMDSGAAVVAVAEADGGASTGAVETSTNLADLITSALREAAEEQGVDYDGTTSVPRATWGQIKERAR